MRSWTIAFSAGVLLLLQLPTLPNITIFILIFLTGLLVSAIYVWRKYFLCLLLSGLLSGFCYCYLHVYWQLQQRLPAALVMKTLQVRGVITSIPESFTFGKRFIFKITASDNPTFTHLPIKARLSMSDKQIALKPGQTWALTVRLKAPHSLADPGSFDYAAWLFEENIQATGSVVTSPSNQLLHDTDRQYPLAQFRLWLSARLDKYSADTNTIGLINALLIGDRQAVTHQQLQLFQQTGTSHLLAISGLHIGLVAAWCYVIMLWLWRRSSRCCLRIAAPKIAAIASIIGAISYASLAGLSIPTQRALLMITIAMLARFKNKSLLNWHSWCLALLAVLLFDPLAMLSPGFYLSFIAVACLIYGTSARLYVANRYWQWIRPQFCVVLGVMPLTAWYFFEVSGLGFIANAIAIPIASLIIVPLILLAALSLLFSTVLTKCLLFLAAIFIKILFAWLAFLSRYQFFIWHYTIANHYVLICSYIGLILLLAPRAWPMRYLAILFCLPLFYYAYPVAKSGQFYLTVLDVGQGLSVVVRTHSHVLIYDTGAKFSDNFDMGEAVAMPFLLKNNIHAIDTVVISHGDNDHIGGLSSLQNYFPIKQILTSVPEKISKGDAQLCQAGQHWQWDGVDFMMLYPQDNYFHLDNNSSCVLKISNGQQSVLLTGDIEKLAEDYLAQQQKTQLASSILIVPHHGSSTSSTDAFIDAVHPDMAFISAGYYNRYHLPKPVVIKRYQDKQVQVFDTVNSGALTVLLSKQAQLGKPDQYRLSHRHLWG